MREFGKGTPKDEPQPERRPAEPDGPAAEIHWLRPEYARSPGRIRDVRHDEAGGHHVVTARLDVGEATGEAAGELFGHALLVAICPADGPAGHTPVDDICETVTTLLNPKGVVAEWAGEVVRGIVAHALAAPGPVAVGIALFTGTVTENLVDQALDPDEDAERRADAVDLMRAALDSLDDSPLRSEAFRDHVEELFGEKVCDLLDEALTATDATAADRPVIEVTARVICARDTETGLRSRDTETGLRRAASSADGRGIEVTVVALAGVRPRHTVWAWVSRDGMVVGEVRLLADGTVQWRLPVTRWRLALSDEWHDCGRVRSADRARAEARIRELFPEFRALGLVLRRVR